MPDDWDLISSYAGLVCLAGASICCGAFDSLPPSPRNRGAPKGSLLQSEEDVDEEDIPDRMSSADAWLFPVLGSAVLFGMYALVTYVGKEWINWLLGWYFSIVGVGSVWKVGWFFSWNPSTVSLAKFAIGRERWRTFELHRLLLLRGPLEIVSLSFRTPTMLLLPVAMVPSMLYSFSAGSRKSALWTDVLALSFSHNALSILRLDSFRTGCILLSGLFFYDVYWVFGTDVMVKVAASLDVPIKLLWPKSMTFTTERGFTMLGLGDVVVPGVFIALALRYDHARADETQRSFAKPYFFVTLSGYVLGLVTTMTVMHALGRAQPALLYLSPACMLSLMATAFVRGEVVDVWGWSDDPELSRQKKEGGVELLALSGGQNGNSTPHPDKSADDGRADAEGTAEGGSDEQGDGADEARAKRRGGGKKKEGRGGGRGSGRSGLVSRGHSNGAVR